jgi:hypothetical protein
MQKQFYYIADARLTFAWLAFLIGFDNFAAGQAHAPLPAHAVINQGFEPARQTSAMFLACA